MNDSLGWKPQPTVISDFRYNEKFWLEIIHRNGRFRILFKNHTPTHNPSGMRLQGFGFNLNSLSFVNIFSVVFNFVLIAKNACIYNRRKVFRFRLHFRSSQFIVNFCNVLIRKLNSLFPKKPLHKRLSHRQAFLPLKLPQKKIARVGYFAFPVHRITLGCFGKICLFCPRNIQLNPPLQKVFHRQNLTEKPECQTNRPPKTSISTVLWDKTKTGLTFVKSQNHCNRMNHNRETPATKGLRATEPWNESTYFDKISKRPRQKGFCGKA